MTPLVLALALLVLGALTVCAQGVGGLADLPRRERAGPNLMENAGFEAKAEAGGPAKWSLGAEAGLWSLDTTARSGGASLKLSGVDRQPRVPAAEQTVDLAPGFYTLEGWVRAAKLGATRERSGVRLCLEGRPRRNWWKCTDIVRGSGDWKLLRQPLIAVTSPGPYRVTVGAYGGPDGEAWFDDVSLVQVRRPVVDAYLLYPNFRGLLFDDRSQTVRLSVVVAEDAGASQAGARLRVSLVDEGGTVRGTREYERRPGRLVAELDASALPAGAYRLRAELVGRGGETLERAAEYRVVKVPATARKRFNAWYDERNVTYLGGKPAFVLGLYNTGGYALTRQAYALGRDGWGNARIAEAPVNMLINYWLGAAPIPALEAYMDDLHGRGIWYLQTVNFYHSDDPQYKTIPYAAAKRGDAAANRWVAKTLSDHRGLAGFYTADERPADLIPNVFRQHQALSEAAPGTLTYGVLGNGWEGQAPLWRDAVDVMGLDPYPITKPRGQNHLAEVGEWTRLGQDAVQRSRPLWMVIQYFPLTSAGGWPTREELRAMSWMAIVEGARGLFYWSFGNRGLAWVKDPREREQRWQDLVQVTKEIKVLEPVLLAEDATVLAGEPNATLRTLGKRGPDGARYLFAYNTGKTPASATWTLAAPARTVEDLDGGPAPALSNGTRLAVEFGPYAVKRLRLR
ncbi:MAG: hypothetical protein ACREJV_14375 [Candidatus Rokuibacteriota bacterium]